MRIIYQTQRISWGLFGILYQHMKQDGTHGILYEQKHIQNSLKSFVYYTKNTQKKGGNLPLYLLKTHPFVSDFALVPIGQGFQNLFTLISTAILVNFLFGLHVNNSIDDSTHFRILQNFKNKIGGRGFLPPCRYSA